VYAARKEIVRCEGLQAQTTASKGGRGQRLLQQKGCEEEVRQWANNPAKPWAQNH